MADDYIRKADAIKQCGFGMTSLHIADNLRKMRPADVVPVVRCKDCEWAVKSTELPGWYMCKCEEAFDYYAKPDDFCSHGERKE